MSNKRPREEENDSPRIMIDLTTIPDDDQPQWLEKGKRMCYPPMDERVFRESLALYFPTGVIALIASYVGKKTRQEMVLACKYFRKAIYQANPWRELSIKNVRPETITDQIHEFIYHPLMDSAKLNIHSIKLYCDQYGVCLDGFDHLKPLIFTEKRWGTKQVILERVELHGFSKNQLKRFHPLFKNLARVKKYYVNYWYWSKKLQRRLTREQDLGESIFFKEE